MTTMVNHPTLGLERVARQALIVLIDTLNDELPVQEDLWADEDEELADKRGIDYVPITLEPIELENFYYGYQPSLINAEISKYPNVAVIADATSEASDNTVDQVDSYLHRLAIEVMVKSNEEDTSEIVNSRAQRTADAVNICMMSNRTLRGTVHGFEGAPTANLTEVFLRKEQTAYGNIWQWQGARIEYEVRKDSQIPSGLLSQPAATSASHLPMGADIDQA